MSLDRQILQQQDLYGGYEHLQPLGTDSFWEPLVCRMQACGLGRCFSLQNELRVSS